MLARPEHLRGICAPSHQPHYYSASFALDYQLAQFCASFLLCFTNITAAFCFAQSRKAGLPKSV